MNISNIGEAALIKKIAKKSKIRSKKVIKGIGDDAAVFQYSKQQYLVITTDTLVEGQHFTKKWFTPQQIGAKAIEINVSDIAAMGAVPKYALLSFSLPSALSVSYYDNLVEGITKRAKKYGIDIIGGNIAKSSHIEISITLLGLVDKKKLCLRSNAKPGQLICVTNSLGAAATGYHLAKKRKKGPSLRLFLEPKAQLPLSKVCTKHNIKTMIDISDGLASEVHHIGEASNAGAIIYQDKLPITKTTVQDSKKINKNPVDLALYGGEDYQLVFTASKKNYEKLKKKKLPITNVGIITKNKKILLSKKNKKITLKKGFDHFKISGHA